MRPEGNLCDTQMISEPGSRKRSTGKNEACGIWIDALYIN